MELESVTSSYSRKVNHSLYGGAQYESSDHFVSMTATLDEGEDVREAQEDYQFKHPEAYELV